MTESHNTILEAGSFQDGLGRGRASHPRQTPSWSNALFADSRCAKQDLAGDDSPLRLCDQTMNRAKRRWLDEAANPAIMNHGPHHSRTCLKAPWTLAAGTNTVGESARGVNGVQKNLS
jgi:hypothetical protein